MGLSQWRTDVKRGEGGEDWYKVQGLTWNEPLTTKVRFVWASFWGLKAQISLQKDQKSPDL